MVVYLPSTTTKREQPVVTPQNARILFGTSFLALTTLALAAFLRVYDGVAITSAVFLTSVNYWRRPVYGFRRNLDITVSTLCLIYQTLRCFSTERRYAVGYLAASYTGVALFLVSTFAGSKGSETLSVVLHAVTHALGNVGNIFLYVGLARVHNRWKW